MSRVGVGDRVRGLVGGFWMTWCVLFFSSCLFLEIYWGEVEELKFPFGKESRRMDALGLSRLRVQQAKTSCSESEQNFGGKL